MISGIETKSFLIRAEFFISCRLLRGLLIIENSRYGLLKTDVLNG